MRPLAKLGLIALGYVAAFVIASVVVAIRVGLTRGPDAQASSGMYAAGDALLFLIVFGVLALVPTAAGLYLLRPYRRFWSLAATAVVTVAATGLAAVALYALREPVPSFLAPWTMLSPLRILVAPLLALAFLVCALVAPSGGPRLALLAAAVTEVAVSGYGAYAWVGAMFGRY